jgi:hypothetical protein
MAVALEIGANAEAGADIGTGELEMPLRETPAQTWRAPPWRRHWREHQALLQRAHAGKLVPGVLQVAHITRLVQRRERFSRDARDGGVLSAAGRRGA